MNRKNRLLWIFAGAFLVVSLISGLTYQQLCVRRYGAFGAPRFVDLPRGVNSREMASRLAEAGVVASKWHFLAVRLLRRLSPLQAGEYEFGKPDTVWHVYSRIAGGDVQRYRLTVPEGSNIFDIARLLDGQGIVSGDEFRRAAQSPDLVRDLAPEAKTLEGFLFPATYYLTRDTTAQELAERMTQQFRRVWKKMGGKADIYSRVTLASLVEKETSVADERPLVASVYHNRLEKGMLLQCDPTVIYAALLTDNFRGAIYQSDLERNNPYNTYQHGGLPPGPIANPGEAALRAALQPAETNYLYFVAKANGDGEHVFSESLVAHEQAVRRYRRAHRKQSH